MQNSHELACAQDLFEKISIHSLPASVSLEEARMSRMSRTAMRQRPPLRLSMGMSAETARRTLLIYAGSVHRIQRNGFAAIKHGRLIFSEDLRLCAAEMPLTDLVVTPLKIFSNLDINGDRS